MKKIILAIAILTIVTSVQAENYYGTYSGTDSGVWSICKLPWGDYAPTIIFWSNISQAGMSGEVLIFAGNQWTIRLDEGTIVKANFDDSGDVTGTWANGSFTGMLQGSEISPLEVSDYAGNYTVITDNGDIIDIVVDSQGGLSGRIDDNMGLGVINQNGNIQIYFSNLYTITVGTIEAGKYYDIRYNVKGSYYNENIENPEDQGYVYPPYIENPHEREESGCFITGVF